MRYGRACIGVLIVACVLLVSMIATAQSYGYLGGQLPEEVLVAAQSTVSAVSPIAPVAPIELAAQVNWYVLPYAQPDLLLSPSTSPGLVRYLDVVSFTNHQAVLELSRREVVSGRYYTTPNSRLTDRVRRADEQLASTMRRTLTYWEGDSRLPSGYLLLPRSVGFLL